MKEEILTEATATLKRLLNDYKNQGLVAIYLWGSIITPDFNPATSDIDAVGFLTDKADFAKLDRIREWLPKANPKLLRLQINFFYISELTGEKPVRSRLARLSSPEQAVFDFPNWQYVCGERIGEDIFPIVSPKQFLKDQIKVVKEREKWARNPKTPNDIQYYCKSLVWLCVAIHKLSHNPDTFSWQSLEGEADTNTRHLVHKLVELKKGDWNIGLLERNLPILMKYSHRLIQDSTDESSIPTAHTKIKTDH